jgi:mannosylglycerate hydrolase
VLEARWPLPLARGAARLVVRLHDDSPLVHCRLEIVNRGTDHRLRARIPLGAPGAAVLAGTQFGAIERAPLAVEPAAPASPRETPVPTFPVHRFAAAHGAHGVHASRAAAGGVPGLALLAPGFFEGEWTPGGELLFTILRAVGWLSRGDLPTRPGHAGWPEPVPLAQCLGPDHLEIALLPLARAEEREPGALHRAWEDAFLPVQGWWIPNALALAPAPDAIELEGDGLVASTVKPAHAGPGVVLRCVNVSDAPVTGRWRFGVPAARAWRVNADERETGPAEPGDGGRELRFEAPARAWVSHRVEWLGGATPGRA